MPIKDRSQAEACATNRRGGMAACLSSLLMVLAVPGAAAGPSFAVASVKANPGCSYSPERLAPNRIDFVCAPLRGLIAMAYGHHFAGERFTFERPLKVIGGPAWLDNERYDVSATVEGAGVSTETMVGPMLRGLLEERLALKIHKEARETPVYVLTTSAKLKLTPAVAGLCSEPDLASQQATRDALIRGQQVKRPIYCGIPQQKLDAGVAKLEVYSATPQVFADTVLGTKLDRPVVDKTGLTGRYDIKLEFADSPFRQGPIQLNGAPASPGQIPQNDDTAGPSIFTALQRLGLKLVPDKAPLDVIVIDHVEKPSAN